MANIELYHFWDSFCSFKVRICLEEKGLSWTGHYIDLMAFENLKPDYLSINKKAVVPTLRYDGQLIPESSIINEFLDDQFPDPPLKPVGALDRARMRYWVTVEEDELFTAIRPASLNLMMKKAFSRYSSADLDRLLSTHPRQHQVPLLKKMFTDPYDEKAVEQSRRALARTLGQIEKNLSNSGPWLAGSSYSLADIAAAPVVDRIERLGMSDLWTHLPAVQRWVESVKARPAYQRALPKDEFRMPAAAAA